MSYLRKPATAGEVSALSATPDGGDFQVNYPALWEYLAYGQYPDGSARVTATLLVVYEDGLLKLCLNDRAAERSAWASSDEFYDLFEGMNKALAEGTVVWRRKPPYTPVKKGK